MGERCTAPGCNQPAKSAGFCGPHYEQMRRRGYVRPIRRLRTPGPYSFTALVDRLGLDTKKETCQALGLNTTTYDTYLAGGLNDHGADVLATRAGLHPALVWGWDWVAAGLTPLDEILLETGWRQAWLHRETERAAA